MRRGVALPQRSRSRGTRPLVAPERVVQYKKEVYVAKASMIEEVSYYVGKGIVLFTMFYCGMNWYHYRDLRKRMEEEDRDGKGGK